MSSDSTSKVTLNNQKTSQLFYIKGLPLRRVVCSTTIISEYKMVMKDRKLNLNNARITPLLELLFEVEWTKARAEIYKVPTWRILQ